MCGSGEADLFNDFNKLEGGLTILIRPAIV